MLHIASRDVDSEFEDVEEKLKQLEEMPLLPAGVEEAEGSTDPGEQDAAGTHPRAEDHAPLASAKSSGRAFESLALQECRAQTRYLIQGTVEEARYRLKSLAGAIIPALQSDLEKSLDQAASAAISRAAASFERQIQEVITRTADEVLERLRIGILEAASTAKEADDPQEKRLEVQEVAQALAPVIDETRDKLASFLEDARQQLQNALRAFEENTARHATGESRKTALPEGEIGQLHEPDNVHEAPTGELPSPAIQKSDKPDPQITLADTVSSPPDTKPLRSVPAAQPASYPPEKPRQKQASWRILGL